MLVHVQPKVTMKQLPPADQLTTLQDVDIQSVAIPTQIPGHVELAIAVSYSTQKLTDPEPLEQEPLVLGPGQARSLGGKLIEAADAVDRKSGTFTAPRH